MYSPMEQFVIFPILNVELTLSNNIFYLLIAVIISITLSNNGRTGKILTNNWGILSESLFRTVLNMLENFVSPKAAIYLPLFYSVAMMILFSNFLGLIPYSSTPTVEIVMTLSYSFTLIIGFAVLGFLTHGFYLLSIFLPGGTPIGLIPLMVILEVNAYLTRTLSLGLRLAINLITGHILCKVVAGFLWIGHINKTNILILSFGVFLLTVFLCLEFLVAYLQCYIFLFISLLTLKDVSLTN
jgi:F-type H+-transporting ATPase subunit a